MMTKTSVMRNESISIQESIRGGGYRAWYMPTMQHGMGATPKEAVAALYALISDEGIGRYREYKRMARYFQATHPILLD